MARLPVVIITGSSSGIGLELALSLSRKPYTVVATLRKPDAANAELRAANCDIQALDVTCEKSVANLASYVKGKYAGCDIVINNAGFGMPGCLEAMSVESAKRVFDVNVWGVMRMCQAFSPQMRDRGGGLILVVSSTSGLRAHPFADIYVSSKYAVGGLMESYRYAVEQDNIKIALVNPGYTVTPYFTRYCSEMQQHLLSHDPYKDLTLCYAEATERKLANGQPVAECVNSIMETLEREFNKNVADGTETVTFWNPTSEFGVKVVNDVLRHPDGHSGEYGKNFKGIREIVRSMKSGKQS